LDCTVILLSATLPQKKRKELLNAYRVGAAETTPHAPYPRVTVVGRDVAQGQDARRIELGGHAKDICLEIRPTDAVSLAESIAEDLPQGGCVAVLCNTVGRAQEVYQAATCRLKKEGWEVILLHARTPFCWRDETETAILAKFGKAARRGVGRPEKCVLISTQIIEQSLDLDFDLMYSELAPIDLLLQRMGRLFRHDDRPASDRPVGAEKPRFVLLTDADPHAESPPASLGVNDEKIYDRFVRLRTLLALRPYLSGGRGDPEPLRLPNAIEPLVHLVYDLPDGTGHSLGDPDLWKAPLAVAFALMQNKDDTKRDNAAACMLCFPKKPKHLIGSREITQALYDEDDPTTHETVKAKTRDGEPSVKVICTGDAALGEKLARHTNQRPTMDDARELLQYAVPVSDRSVFEALKGADVTSWRKNGLLQFCRRLHFTKGICTEVPGMTITLDKEYGFRIQKVAAKR
jgi:CRISPR-associated endonuclease/helicase Cas3